jgi:hypothetical protein
MGVRRLLEEAATRLLRSLKTELEHQKMIKTY